MLTGISEEAIRLSTYNQFARSFQTESLKRYVQNGMQPFICTSEASRQAALATAFLGNRYTWRTR
jgi:hypothetical protein